MKKFAIGVGAAALLLALAGCQAKTPTPAASGKSASLRAMETVAIAAHKCWFTAKDPAFIEKTTSLGIVPTVRHADYLGNWLGVLKEDGRAIFRAASQASKSADFILAFDAGASRESEAA